MSQNIFVFTVIAGLLIGTVLSAVFYCLISSKIQSNSVLSKKELYSLILTIIGLSCVAIISFGIFPGIIIHWISFPIYYALHIEMIGEEWWAYMILADILYAMFIIPLYLMSKYVYLFNKKKQTILFAFLLILFALVDGLFSAVPDVLWNAYY